MMSTIVLSLLLSTFIFVIYKKEQIIVTQVEEEEEEAEEEEAPVTIEQEEIEEIESAIERQINEINVPERISIKKKYDNYSADNDKYESVDFKETKNKMLRRNEDIPIENPYKFNVFPSRINEHTWDYTGVSKIEPRDQCKTGVDSSLNKRHPQMFFHPTNYNL